MPAGATAQVLSVQIVMTRNAGSCLSCSKIEELTREEMEKMLADEVVRMAARASMEVIKRLDEQIRLTEKMVKEKAKLRDEFKLLKTVWGVGTILH